MYRLKVFDSHHFVVKSSGASKHQNQPKSSSTLLKAAPVLIYSNNIVCGWKEVYVNVSEHPTVNVSGP